MNNRRALRGAAAIATILFIVSCGGGGGAGNGATSGAAGQPAGVDGTKSLRDATEADMTATCDWYAGLVGGYGAQSTCNSAVLNAPPTQADCLASFPSCDVTFASFESCVVAVVGAQMSCTDTSVRDAEDSAACADALPAGCF